MADEPRRSGRATKGQHTKDREDSEGAPKPKGKAKGKKSKSDPEPEDEEAEEEEYIRCICGRYEEEEDEPRAMICCDKCSAWQHNDCMGLAEDYEADSYFCEQCKPADHRELLKAMQRGEKPWEAADIRRALAKQDKEAKKKGKKGARKSTGRASDAGRTPTLEPEEPVASKKRKAVESPAPEVSAKSKRARSSLRESTSGAVAEDEPEDDHQGQGVLAGVAKDAKDISDPSRSKIASSIVKPFIDQTKHLVQSKAVSLPKGDTATTLGTQVALQVEHAVYHIKSGGAGDPSDAYRDHIRAILNNFKTNTHLATRLISGQLRADELAAMDPRDMATDEQKLRDAEEKLRMEKQHVLVEEQAQGPRIRRTHKGDEYVDGSGQPAESEVSRAPVQKPNVPDQDTEMKSPPTPADKPSVMRKPSASAKGKPFADNRRKSSSNFDLDKVYSGIQAQGSPTGQDAPKLPDAPQRGSPPPMNNAVDADAEVDRLLKDEENDSEPYSPKDFVEEGVVWRGRVNGGSLGTFNTVARFAAGCQPDVENLNMTWSQVIPAELKLHGRIQPSKADDYLCGLEYSNTTELVIISLAEPKEQDDKQQFDKFFNYLKGKDRYGVGSQHQVPAIKDIYLLPMEIGQPLPTVMKALEHTQADPVTERSFLVPIVIKWTELPHNADRVASLQRQQQAAQSPSVGPPVAQTPITPHEPQHTSWDSLPPYQPSAAPYTHPTATANSVNGAHQPTPSNLSAHAPVQSRSPAQQQTPAAINALKVLGPEMSQQRAVLDLIAQAPTAGENEFNIIKECITENPQAGQSLAVLTQMLQQKYQSQRSSRGQQEAQPPAVT